MGQGKWLCDFWLWEGGANCIMVFPSSENRSPEVIKAPIQFVPNLGQGFMNSSCNVQWTMPKSKDKHNLKGDR